MVLKVDKTAFLNNYIGKWGGYKIAAGHGKLHTLLPDLGI